MNKKAGLVGGLITICLIVVFAYVAIKQPALLKDAALWALDLAKQGWSFVMEKING